MASIIQRYTHWLHTKWPAGLVEKLPESGEGGITSIPGVRIVGDLTGIPLLKFSADTGARAVQAMVAEPDFPAQRGKDGVLDLAIIGGGVSGYAAALEAKKAGLNFRLFEAVQDFSTIVNFPKGKPIYTYPTNMTPAGDLQFKADIKEGLLAELEEQRRTHSVNSELLKVDRIERKEGKLFLHSQTAEPVVALRVIVAIGRSGNFRKLGIPGEELEKVSNRLHDPNEFSGKRVLVVGGGDSALETATALHRVGAKVTLSYRRREFSRPKPENIEKIETAHSSKSFRLLMESEVEEIRADTVVLKKAGGEEEDIENEAVFVMTGREAPLDFFRRSGLAISGEWRWKTWAGLLSFFVLCFFVYHWKSGGWLTGWWSGHGWFPFNISGADPKSLAGSVINAARDPGFYYSLAYTTCIIIFGLRRIRRRKTPYVTRQTLSLMAFQVIPLFLLPYIFLPWMGHNGVFEAGLGKWIGDVFFPDGSYWRAFGFILAWPLFIWNVFTDQPVWGWLILSLIQTFVIIPWIVWRWGKGAYCGWVCSCGALAETLGDKHRHKMPHGPFWNRLNMVGQVVLGVVFLLFFLRVLGWIFPGSLAATAYEGLLSKFPVINYKYIVDLWFAGILGVTFYFHFSGRIWCRFACPLAALMHIYARFTRFRIFAEKKKCISCNVCTAVCHQGIDVMSFANKGMPMEDPECVRCSACVQSCPTGVLSFGRFAGNGDVVLDSVAASPVQMKEQANSLTGFLKDINKLEA
jgi:NosR/NirI family transcriptional regulator, nitrous oxide reductase regulator